MGLRCLSYKLKKEAADPGTVTGSFVWTKGYLGKQTPVNADSKLRDTIEKMKEYELPAVDQNSSSIHDDAISYVFGPEHPGRVMGMGFGVTPSKVNAICGAARGLQKTTDPKVEKLRKTVYAIKGALRAAGLSLDVFIHEINTEPIVSHPVSDPGSGGSWDDRCW